MNSLGHKNPSWDLFVSSWDFIIGFMIGTAVAILKTAIAILLR